MSQMWDRASAEPVIRDAIRRVEKSVAAVSHPGHLGCASPHRDERQVLRLAVAEILDAMFPLSRDEQVRVDLARHIEELPLSMREYNILKREGVHSVGHLTTLSADDLADFRNWGAGSTLHVAEILHSMGLGLTARPKP